MKSVSITSSDEDWHLSREVALFFHKLMGKKWQQKRKFCNILYTDIATLCLYAYISTDTHIHIRHVCDMQEVKARSDNLCPLSGFRLDEDKAVVCVAVLRLLFLNFLQKTS